MIGIFICLLMGWHIRYGPRGSSLLFRSLTNKTMKRPQNLLDHVGARVFVVYRYAWHYLNNKHTDTHGCSVTRSTSGPWHSNVATSYCLKSMDGFAAMILYEHSEINESKLF
jgi:hypothetical protein